MDALTSMSDNDILNATRQFESQARTLKNQITRINQESKQFEARIKENQEKIKLSTRMPYLVATVGELLTPIDEEDEAGSGLGGSSTIHGNRRNGKDEEKVPVKAVVIKTSSR
jgi:26S proteasome regulatory subunit T5